MAETQNTKNNSFLTSIMNGIMSSNNWNMDTIQFGSNQSIGPSGLSGDAARGLGVQYIGGLLGNQIGGTWGNALGSVAGNLGENISQYGFNAGLKNFGSNIGNLGANIGSGIINDMTSHQRTSGKYGGIASSIDGVAGMFGSNPYASLAMSGVNWITGGTDGMTVADAALGSPAIAGALMSMGGPAGMAAAAGYMALSGINSATGKTTMKNMYNDFESKQELSHLAGSYGKSTADNLDAAQYGNKKYGGFSVLAGSFSKANDKVKDANDRKRKMLSIYDRYDLGRIRGGYMADINSLNYDLYRDGGYNQYGTYIGRKGMKLPTKNDIDKIKNILSYQNGGRQKKYNTHYNGERCNTQQCAQFSNETLRDEGYDTRGNAWNLKNAKLIFNGYDGLQKPRKYNVNDVVSYNHQAAQNFLKNFDSKTLDPDQLYVVNMYVNGSPAQKEAYDDGRDDITSTHTGYLYNDGKDWKVVHNIHGIIHVDPFFNIQGKRGNYGVTAIYKPTKGLFGLGFLGLKCGGKIDSFKKGGQMNVIPEGALHARLHHMESGDKITKKGIPVVDKSGEQQAEIERNEIIFSLDVTTKLEALKRDGSDKAAIKAGKLLVDEIFNNTDDRTGLIADVISKDEAKKPVFKQGGTIEIEEPQFETELEVEEPVGIEEVEYYQSGGKYKVPIYVNVEEGQYPRTEGDIIYATTPEQKYHEYAGHFAPNDKLLQELEQYWKDLDDTKLQQFGTDLGFVNKDDINYFFNPNEVLGRVEAARYMLGNDIWKVNPEFFVNLKNDENKYGDNMRDLLHMYNPEILTKIFEIARKHEKPIITGQPNSKFEGKELLDNVLMDKSGGIIKIEKPLEYTEYYQNGGKKKRTPRQIWMILNADDNFDDGFIDDPDYDDDLRYISQPESVREKITEEEWEDFLDDMYHMQELVDEAKKQNPRFIQRLLEEPRGINFIDDMGNAVRGSHYLSSGEDDFGGYVFPRIQEQPDGSLKFFRNSDEALRQARNNNNILRFESPMDAFRFSTRYKRFFPEFFKILNND